MQSNRLEMQKGKWGKERLATGISDERQCSFSLHQRQIMGDLK